MQYFVGRVCSVVTASMNRSFDERVSREHFVVRIGEVTTDGIWGVHPYNDELVSFFRMDHVISIHVETELDPENPEHAAMIREFEQESGKKVMSDLKTPPKVETNPLAVIEKPPASEEPDAGDATFVDIDRLERLAEISKQTFDAHAKHPLNRL